MIKGAFNSFAYKREAVLKEFSSKLTGHVHTALEDIGHKWISDISETIKYKW